MTEETNDENRVLTPHERKVAAGMKNLKKWTPEGRSLGGKRKAEIALLNREIQAQFKLNATAFSKVLADIPALSSLDVIRMCVHMALQDNNYEDAARWAKELAEYEKPKLQRIEQVNKNFNADLSDDELYETARKEGLLKDDHDTQEMIKKIKSGPRVTTE